MDSEESENYTELTTLIWNVLKSILFSSIVLFQAVTIDLSHFSGLMNIPQAPQNVLSTLANLSFISEQLRQGLTSRNIFEKILMNTMTFLLHDDNNEVLNEMIGQAFKEYGKFYLDINIMN
jgi:hypothetical protein